MMQEQTNVDRGETITIATGESEPVQETRSLKERR